ncbi:hypothetical protein Plhal304r1_c012g0047761 [Plasmopara halstedii]
MLQVAIVHRTQICDVTSQHRNNNNSRERISVLVANFLFAVRRCDPTR